jgi:methoxymalonate biosynthesis acyl carrier protein
MNDSVTKIRAFLAKYLQHIDLQDDQDIFAMGFVNSLFAIQLITFVEGEFGIAVEDEDLTLENFSTVNAIVHLVKRKTLFEKER